MTDYERIERVIRFLEKNYLDQPSLATLAKVAGLSESHFHRLFSRWAGTTPKSFLKYLTARHAKELLRQSQDLLSATLSSGLSSPGRLHDLLISIDAMTPGEFKAKGLGVEILYGIHPSPFGDCLIGVTRRGICHLAFVDSDRKAATARLKRAWPKASFKPEKITTGKTIRQIFGKRKNRLSIFLKGTPFQLKVWEALLQIPPGKILSYTDIARAIGSPKSSRAVGSAVGSNTIAYLIPCHRVIRESGAMGGYHWGIPRKQAILGWEAR